MGTANSALIVQAGPGSNRIQNEIYDAFSTSIFVPNRLNVQDTPLYDQVVLAAGATITPTATRFENVTASSGKTVGQTNCPDVKKLPSPQAFSILAMSLYIRGDILPADLLSLYDNCVLEFYLGDGKPYHQAPLYTIPSAGGIFAQDNTAGARQLSNGYPDRNSMRKLASTLVIENNLNFYAQLNGNLTTGLPLTLATALNGGTGFTMQLTLFGFWAKGVQ